MKPFIKWVGGKGQLVNILEKNLPSNYSQIDTYIEPFIGGGSFFIHNLNKEKEDINGKKKIYVINDLNYDLINCYWDVKLNHIELMDILDKYENEFNNSEDKKEYYYKKRDIYNDKTLGYSYERSALFIFLNKTCFNGLYRVNNKGEFNTPFNKKEKIKLYDRNNIIELSLSLKRTIITHGSYNNIIADFLTPIQSENKIFVYLDPPYRPLDKTSSFNKYISIFNDEEQIKLKKFCDILNSKGILFMLSNSDPHNTKLYDDFLYDLYRDYDIQKIEAKRMINSKGDKRGKITELLIRNYT